MRDPAAVFVANAAWSLLGLFVGFVLGRITREVHEVHEVVAPLDERLPVIESPPHPYRRSGDRTRRRDKMLALALILLAIGSVATAALAVDRRSALAECQTDYNARVILSIKARQLANDVDRTAIVDLVRTVANVQSSGLPPAVDRERTNMALRHYLDTSAASDAIRRSRPLPEVLSCP